MSTFRMKKSADVIEKEIAQEKRLVDASQYGKSELVTRLLQGGVSPDASEYNRSLFYASKNYLTPLMIACKHGHIDIVRALVEREADVNAKDRFDVTALHLAAERGHVECLRALLEEGADVNVETKYSKFGSYTAGKAKKGKQKECEKGEGAVPYPGGTTALHNAAKHNHIKCIVELIWYGADYNAVDEHGETSLYIAAHRGFADSVMAHLDNAIRTDILSLPVKESEETPLHECVKHALPQCVTALLLRGSDVNHRDSGGHSPLHIACFSRETFSFPILRSLVLHGYNVDINLPDTKGFTPLHYVTCGEGSYHERRPEVAIFLIALGANYDIKTKGESLMSQELRMGRHGSQDVLEAVVACTTELPSEESLLPSYGQQGAGRPLNLATNVSQILEWYRRMRCNPRPLQNLCRIIIRNAITPRRLPKVATLPIPVTLKEFLLLEQVNFS